MSDDVPGQYALEKEFGLEKRAEKAEAENERLRAVVEAARTYRAHLVSLREFVAEHLNAPPTADELAARVDATEAAFASLSAALDQREAT